MTGSPGTRLRDRLADQHARGPLLIPGAHDALAAVLIAQAGFEAVYLTGFGASASLLGTADIGLLSAGEMTDQARRLCAAVDLPVVADADTGYGNALNVARTVHEYDRAGVAAIQLEDQIMPKRCGHMNGKEIISSDEMAGKIHAAVDARRDPDLVVIARTDAVSVEGLDAAITRAHTYREAGADALFIEAPNQEADLIRIAGELADEAPLVLNLVEGGRTPQLPYQRIAELGFAMVLYPIGAVLAAAKGIRAHLTGLAADRALSAALASTLPSFADFTELVGLSRLRELEQRYTPTGPAKPAVE